MSNLASWRVVKREQRALILTSCSGFDADLKKIFKKLFPALQWKYRKHARLLVHIFQVRTFSMSYPPPPRVIQLDASRLDDELLSLFVASLQSALRRLPSSVTAPLLPNLKPILRLIYLSNTFLLHAKTPGSSLFNLHHTALTSSPLPLTTRLLYVFLDSILPLLHPILLRTASPVHLRHFLISLDPLIRLLHAVNLLLFFRSGVHKSLVDRLLQVRLSYVTRPSRAPLFEFVNAQLVWQGVADLALLLAPLLAATASIRQLPLARRLLQALGLVTVPHSLTQTMSLDGTRLCFKCGATCVMPHRMLPCQHQGCWICVAGTSRCAACGTVVTAVERVAYG